MPEELIGGTDLYDDRYRQVQEELRRRSEEAVRQADGQRSASLSQVRVLVVDDQDLVRSGFRLLLSSYDSIKVVGEASNGLEAYDQARETHPDVVLMDIRMPLENGIEATRRIMADESLAPIHVLVLTTFDDDEYVYDSLAAGASGFMLKDSEPDDIADAIAVVSSGDALIQPSITRRLVEAFVADHVRSDGGAEVLHALTDREREILGLVARGLGNDDIAEQLVISPATVKTHVARIMAKLNAHDRAQLVIIAYETGLVKPGEDADQK